MAISRMGGLDDAPSVVAEGNEEEIKSSLQETFRNLIQQYLAVHMLDNATFYAERLVAACSNDSRSSSLYLLGLCYHRQGQSHRTKQLLLQRDGGGTDDTDTDTPEILFLLAQACFEVEDYTTAEEALLRQVRKDFYKTESADLNQYILTTSPCPIPNGAAGLHLLAKICTKSNRQQRAIQYYKMSLQLDPFLWTSFEALCNLGVDDEDMDPTQIFGVHVPEPQEQRPPPTSSHATTSSNVLTPHLATPAAPLMTPKDPPNSILQPMTTPDMRQTSLFGGPSSATSSGMMFETPNLTPIPNEQSFAAHAPPTRAVQRARKVAFRDYYEPSPETMAPSHGKPRSLFWSGLNNTTMEEDEPSHHKTLFASETKSTAGNSFAAKPYVRSKVVPTAPVTPKQAPAPLPMDPQDRTVRSILELLCLLGAAQLHLGQYRSKKAIALYNQLDDCHYHTGWVLEKVGRAYFSMADYPNAIRMLQAMEQVEPHRMEGLEVLSTALWQTKRDVELSHLAQRVTTELDRLSPQVWCVVGNCFSLQKEHETALSFFRRSIQLDPSIPYSHTLSGHEYFANEDFVKAVACYRDAIRAEERHYNAWYGLGAVYYRQEKFDLAEYHFRRACQINPQSSVLICHLGMAQNSNGKPYEALDTLQRAFSLDSHGNPQAHYQRALVYQSLERHEEALLELERVRDAAPREAQVLFSMGRLYKKLKRPERAMRCFLDALDLDPKDTNLIKAAMEKMNDPDVEEEISAF